MGKSRPFAIEHESLAKPGKVSKIDDQGKMFIEAARELGCDEDPAHFDEILKKVARHNSAPNASSDPKKSKTKKPAK